MSTGVGGLASVSTSSSWIASSVGVLENSGGKTALSSATGNGISGLDTGLGGGGGGFLLELGGCEAARLSTGMPMMFLGDVNTDVGGGGGGCVYAFLSPSEGPEKRLNARLIVEDFSGFSGLSGFSDFSVGDDGRGREAAFSAVFVSVLVGERGAGGFVCASRGGGDSCGSNTLAKCFYAILVFVGVGVVRVGCSNQVKFESAQKCSGIK